MYVPMFFADHPLTGGIIQSKRRSGDLIIQNQLSPLALKAVLLSWQTKRITSETISKLTKTPTTLVFPKVITELRFCLCNNRNLFEVSEIKPFGRQRRIEFDVNKEFDNLFQNDKNIFLDEKELTKTSNNTPIDLLLLLLSKRPQKKNYCDFLAVYFLGISTSALDNVKDDKLALNYKQRITRTWNGVLRASLRLGVKFNYTETRIPVGKYTVKWFEILEFKEE